MNDKFMDEQSGSEEYQYAEMTMIVTKVLRVPPNKEGNDEEIITGECAYIDGVISDLYNTCHIKINKMTAGRYIVFYKAKFNTK